MMSETKGYADRTIAAYRVHAGKASRNWARSGRRPSLFLRRFASELAAAHQRRGASILDYGCGTGVEAAWLRSRGFHVEGVDGTLEFVLEARRRCPGARIQHARFEGVPLPQQAYDAVWCNAALIHVPPEELRRQLEKLKQSVKSGGLLGLTLAWGRAKRFFPKDWIPGRYLAAYSKREAEALLRGWKLKSAAVASGDGRSGRWIQILASVQ